MKRIKCGVDCEYWNQTREFIVEVEDDATEATIAQEIREAAIEAAGFNYWIEEDQS